MKCVGGLGKIGAHGVADEARFGLPPPHACALTMEFEPDEGTDRAADMRALGTGRADLRSLDAAVPLEPPMGHLNAPGVVGILEAGEFPHPPVVGRPVLGLPVSPDDQEHPDMPVPLQVDARSLLTQEAGAHRAVPCPVRVDQTSGAQVCEPSPAMCADRLEVLQTVPLGSADLTGY